MLSIPFPFLSLFNLLIISSTLAGPVSMSSASFSISSTALCGTGKINTFSKCCFHPSICPASVVILTPSFDLTGTLFLDLLLIFLLVSAYNAPRSPFWAASSYSLANPAMYFLLSDRKPYVTSLSLSLLNHP